MVPPFAFANLEMVWETLTTNSKVFLCGLLLWGAKKVLASVFEIQKENWE